MLWPRFRVVIPDSAEHQASCCVSSVGNIGFHPTADAAGARPAPPGCTTLMNHVTSGTGETPASQGFFARIVGVVVSPGATFASITYHPRWADVLAFTVAITILCQSGLQLTDVGKQ